MGEAYLRREIEASGKTGVCDECGNDGPTYSFEEVADRIEAAFERHFTRTPVEPSAFEYALMKETDYDWDREGEKAVYAIASAAQISEETAEQIRLILEARHYDHESATMGEECEFEGNAHYTEKAVDDIAFHYEWSAFERGLKSEARFFSRAAQTALSVIFEDLKNLQTRDGRSAIVDAGPGTGLASLYRARVFQSTSMLAEALKRPDVEIGPPPFIAAAAGRMNAHGISVFYGAINADAAIAEVRPPVGTRTIVGQFEIIRHVRLLDVDALRAIYVKGSIFDYGYLRQLERAKFMGSLSRRMTLPVMPDDEPFEYLVTQAIADYLASELDLDGIIYPSAQVEKENANVVLFHRAARVEPIDLSENCKISVQLEHHTEDGPETDYIVWEESPLPTPKKTGQTIAHPLMGFFELNAYDAPQRTPALRLNVASLQVHHVRKVTVLTEAFSVSRHQITRPSGPC